MNFVKYQYIIEVAEQKSISKAAKLLYISQPALTKHINNIEDELGIKLFNRNTTPITLTFAGERYVNGIRKILEMKRTLDQEIEEIANMKKGRINIGISSSRGEFWLPYILPQFQQRYPSIEVKITEGNTGDLEEYLVKGLVDLGITTLPLLSDEIEYEILTKEEIFLAVPVGHELLEGVDISGNSLRNPVYIEPSRLTGQKLITLPSNCGMWRVTKELWKLYNIKPVVCMETTDLDTAYGLAGAGIGITFISDVCPEENYRGVPPVICTISQPPPMRYSVAAYKKDTSISGALKSFIAVTKEVVTTTPELQPHPDFILHK